MHLILDVDTGVDDALALLLAARTPQVRLAAVTCVAGNAPVDQVVVNTLKVLDAAGASEVPVARGADRPLLEPPRTAFHVHGVDGMGDLGLPDSTRPPSDLHAVELLRRTIEAADSPVTLVALAPLTNVALLLRTYPETAHRLERIMLMGGAAGIGNATATAEFNVWHDPEAAAIVLGSGMPITMYGLDVFYDVVVSRAAVTELTAAADPAPQLAGRLLDHALARFGGDAATIGDAGALASVLLPDALSVMRHPVRVELAGRWTRGATVVDRRTWSGDRENDEHGAAPAEVDVALGVDHERLAALFVDTMLGRS